MYGNYCCLIMESLNLERIMYLTEDEIRDNAKVILGFDEKDPDVKQGTGQITTFNQLGFKVCLISPMDGICPMTNKI